MKTGIVTLISVVSLTLSGCGGGGGDGRVAAADPETSNPSVMNGIYWGTGNESNFGAFELIAFVQDGELYAISDTGVGYRGSLSVDNDQKSYQSKLDLYDLDNSKFDAASAEGSFEPKAKFTGRYDRSSGVTGNFEATYSADAYEQSSSLEKVSGVWTEITTSASNSVTINSNGEIYGTDSDGCVYSGNIATPDTSRNLYNVDFQIENCGNVNGGYSGLAATGSDSSGDWLTLLAGNANYGFAFEFIK